MDFRTVSPLGKQYRLKVASSPRYKDLWDGFESGTWEPTTFFLIEACRNAGMSRFVDVGAHIGAMSLAASALGYQVTAFEPDPVAAAECRSNFALNNISNCHLYQCAISDRSGSVELFNDSFGDSESSVFSSVERGGDRREASRSKSVWSVDLAAVWHLFDLGSKDVFIKMDIEGAEYAALPRVSDLLRHSLCSWHLSLHPMNLVNDNKLFELEKRLLRQLEIFELFQGYDVYLESSVSRIERVDRRVALERVVNSPRLFKTVFFSKAIDPFV